ncbi:MAG: SRPBCC domain-containing protein [Pseudomonadota bacterium]
MTTDTDTFTFTRSFDLPPAKLWHLLTAPEAREIWGAPNDETVLETLSADFTPGGTEHHRCGPKEAPEFEVTTRWYHIDAPQRVTFTEQIHAGGATLGASLVTYALTPIAKGTDLSVTVAVASFVGPDMVDDFRDGWTGGLAQLDKLIASL